MDRYVSEADRKTIIERQEHKCANSPNSNSFRIEDFLCPFWQDKKRNGYVKEGEYDIDHILELAEGGSNDLNNLQALCREYCHKEKTARFNSKRLQSGLMFENPALSQFIHEQNKAIERSKNQTVFKELNDQIRIRVNNYF